MLLYNTRRIGSDSDSEATFEHVYTEKEITDMLLTGAKGNIRCFQYTGYWFEFVKRVS